MVVETKIVLDANLYEIYEVEAKQRIAVRDIDD